MSANLEVLISKKKNNTWKRDYLVRISRTTRCGWSTFILQCTSIDLSIFVLDLPHWGGFIKPSEQLPVFDGHWLLVILMTLGLPQLPTLAPTPMMTIPAAMALAALASAAFWFDGLPSVRIKSNFAAPERPVEELANSALAASIHLWVLVVPPGSGTWL